MEQPTKIWRVMHSIERHFEGWKRICMCQLSVSLPCDFKLLSITYHGSWLPFRQYPLGGVSLGEMKAWSIESQPNQGLPMIIALWSTDNKDTVKLLVEHRCPLKICLWDTQFPCDGTKASKSLLEAKVQDEEVITIIGTVLHNTVFPVYLRIPKYTL